MTAKEKGIEIHTDTFVESVEKEGDLFLIKTDNKCYSAEKVVISVGGMSYPKTGSDGNFYKILEGMGHTIIKPLPALVQLNAVGSFLKNWSGIRVEANIKLYEDFSYVKEETGELLLTNYGVSGICVMQLSGFVSRGLDLGKTEELVINFLPAFCTCRDDFIRLLDERNKSLCLRDISELLELAKNFVEFHLPVCGTNSFNSAQITSGGVSLLDIDLLTMQSRLIKDLYVTGEVLDVNGDCGGYNLTFAFLSGILAGSDICD